MSLFRDLMRTTEGSSVVFVNSNPGFIVSGCAGVSAHSPNSNSNNRLARTVCEFMSAVLLPAQCFGPPPKSNKAPISCCPSNSLFVKRSGLNRGGSGKYSWFCIISYARNSTLMPSLIEIPLTTVSAVQIPSSCVMNGRNLNDSRMQPSRYFSFCTPSWRTSLRSPKNYFNSSNAFRWASGNSAK